ncbi:MAG: hypothetical protein ACK4K8_09325 [Pannonibacter sp.]
MNVNTARALIIDHRQDGYHTRRPSSLTRLFRFLTEALKKAGIV